MNPETNRFEMIPDTVQPKEGMIPFDIGEEIVIKGHVFCVELVDIPKNPTMPHLLVLRPVRRA